MHLIQETILQTTFKIVDDAGNVQQEMPCQPVKVLLTSDSLAAAADMILAKRAELQTELEKQVAAGAPPKSAPAADAPEGA